MWFMRDRAGTRSGWRAVADGEELVRGVEDFLAGHTAARMASAGQRVAPWAVLNTLAHGDPAELRAIAGRHHHPSSHTSVLARLAVTVVQGRDDHEIRMLQRGLLVPLELGVLNTTTADRLTNAQVESVVITVMGHWVAPRAGSLDD